MNANTGLALGGFKAPPMLFRHPLPDGGFFAAFAIGVHRRTHRPPSGPFILFAPKWPLVRIVAVLWELRAAEISNEISGLGEQDLNPLLLRLERSGAPPIHLPRYSRGGVVRWTVSRNFLRNLPTVALLATQRLTCDHPSRDPPNRMRRDLDSHWEGTFLLQCIKFGFLLGPVCCMTCGSRRRRIDPVRRVPAGADRSG
jgi:hypothetical protein